MLQLWQAPEAPSRCRATPLTSPPHALTVPSGPTAGLESALEEAACLTFVPDASTEEVLEAFYADPTDAVAWSDRFEAFPDLDPFVAVLAVPGGRRGGGEPVDGQPAVGAQARREPVARPPTGR